jgi:hypothetical protein
MGFPELGENSLMHEFACESQLMFNAFTASSSVMEHDNNMSLSGCSSALKDPGKKVNLI